MDQNLPPQLDQEKYEKPKKVKDLKDVVEIFAGIFTTISMIFFLFIMISGVINTEAMTFKIIMIPFILILFIATTYSIAKTINLINSNIVYEYLNRKIAFFYNILFFVFFFGFLIYYDYIGIKTWNAGGENSVKGSIIFWIVGIFMAYKKFKKRL